ncbi:glycosyltransferase family 2 protein [Curtobacterium sp. PhB115]|uniref:glycosyltransferase family 2 protein n=1 Tax=Curtobacterium sp. PhB115 TaxID=2485173 RepID=UPI000FB4B881|nr:glycosyltransferase [Curtobacterium sp. PhB115]ROP74840.1 GT2 family glycosyltransferase [Curtobacterium sp. PhB115]
MQRSTSPTDHAPLGISIVIPVGGVDDHLHEQFRAVRAQRTARPIDLVVAANRDVAAVRRAVAAHPWPADWSVRTLDASAVRGPAHARNVGWRHADHEIVLFCDGDDLVDAVWAEQMAVAVEAAGTCGGRLEYERLNPPALAARKSSSTDALPVKFRHLPFSPTCALGVRRELLAVADGFDEDLACGEDIDLCWRLAGLGVRMVFVPGAIVHYRLRMDARGAFGQALRYAADDAGLLRRRRPLGARWGIRDTLRQWAATVLAVARTPTGAEARIVAAQRLGGVLGRVWGTVRYRTYAL